MLERRWGQKRDKARRCRATAVVVGMVAGLPATTSATEPLVFVPRLGHASGATVVAHDAVRHSVTTRGADAEITWSLQTGEVLDATWPTWLGQKPPSTASPSGPEAPPYRVAFSAAGARVVETAAAPVAERRVTVFDEPVVTVETAPDRDVAFAASASGRVALLEAATGEVVREFGGHGPMTHFAWAGADPTASESAWLVTVDEHGDVWRWPVAGTDPPWLLTHHDAAITHLAASEDGLVASGDAEGWVHVVDLETGAPLDAYLHPEQPLTKLGFTPHNVLLSLSRGTSRRDRGEPPPTCGNDTGYDEPSPRIVAWFPGPERFDGELQRVPALDDWRNLGPREQQPANLLPLPAHLSGTTDGQVVVETGGKLPTLTAIGWRPRGWALLALAGDATLVVLKVNRGIEVRSIVTGRTLWRRSANPVVAAFSTDGKRLAFRGPDPEDVFVVEAATGRVVQLWPGRPEEATRVSEGALAWTPDGKALVTSDHDEIVMLQGRKRTVLLEVPQRTPSGWVIRSLIVSGDGRWLAWIRDGVVGTWNLAESRPGPVGEVPTNDASDALFSPNSRTLVARSGRGNLFAWSLPDGHSVELPSLEATHRFLAFTGDGALLSMAPGALERLPLFGAEPRRWDVPDGPWGLLEGDGCDAVAYRTAEGTVVGRTDPRVAPMEGLGPWDR